MFGNYRSCWHCVCAFVHLRYCFILLIICFVVIGLLLRVDFVFLFMAYISVQVGVFCFFVVCMAANLALCLLWSYRSSRSSLTVGTQTDDMSWSLMRPGRTSSTRGRRRLGASHQSRYLSGDSEMHSSSADLEFHRRRVHADADVLLGAECHGTSISPGQRQEQLIVMQVIRALGYRCCGRADYDMSGTNQFYIRVQCCHCLEVCLRYRRSA